MKKGKLTQDEKYIIQGMVSSGKSHDEISEHVDRSVKCVKTYVDNNKLANEEKNTPEVVNPIINKTENGREGISVMTQAASERSDYARQANRQRQHKCRHRNKHIFNTKTGEME